MATRRRTASKPKLKKAAKKVARKAARKIVRHAAKRIAKARPKAVRKIARKAARKIVKKLARRMAVRAKRPAVLKPKPRRRVSPKVLENAHVRNLLVELAGEKALKVAGEMTEPLSDEDIAKRAGIKISDIRAVLNKLHAAGIAAYDRTRNDEGWYTYTWRVSADGALKILEARKAQEKQSAQERLCLESTVDFYKCPNCFARTGARLSFEQAVEAGFRCPDCSEMLRYAEKKG
jgi:transcription factor E